MRYIMIIIAAFILVYPSGTVEAQVRVGISFNLGIQPAWGPVGYDYVENYYMPDIDVYYNVPARRYYYYEGGLWIGRSRLPARFGAFDYYGAHKVIINERQPWRHHDNYKGKYQSFRNVHDQSPIRDSKDSKYFANRYHPQHRVWVQQQAKENRNRNLRSNGNNGNRSNYRSSGNNGSNGKNGNNGNAGNRGGKQNGNRGGKNK